MCQSWQHYFEHSRGCGATATAPQCQLTSPPRRRARGWDHMHDAYSRAFSAHAGSSAAWPQSAPWYRETAQFRHALRRSARAPGEAPARASSGSSRSPTGRRRRPRCRAARAARAGRGLEANPGKRKNGVTGRALGPAVERGVDGGKAAVDLSLGGGDRHAVEQGMRERCGARRCDPRPARGAPARDGRRRCGQAGRMRRARIHA